MKIAALIARLLLGLAFVVFGANGLHPFLPNPGLPPGIPGQFAGAMIASHYMQVVAALQLLGGLLLLVNRYAVLGLTILGPIIVNILLFHILMLSMGISIALFITVLWCIVAWWHRKYFAGLFVQRAE
jgi:hypothetical protein